MAEDPATTSALVRQNLADRHTKARTETQGANQERAGIKFHQVVAGNDTRSAALDAVLRELPNKQASVSMPELLDATGRREHVGSGTTFNHAIKEALSSASPSVALFDMARSLGAASSENSGRALQDSSFSINGITRPQSLSPSEQRTAAWAALCKKWAVSPAGG
ncbi:hypothetical protein D3227_11950 [Mesorhizobium waimense]|uniref:Uncharacterized protein n=1 Tax=Mesorhizobium waimense TaxID=1300307 RepID=A0A3A5L7V2_9HYPH|nr:hypothetical protein [Mesorhizobium waimense]RJT40079.1 hypothetical protein D3227_11950 [Mesorhizobium waimense]